MNSLPLTINSQAKRQKVLVETDLDRFERLAASFGFFSPEFINSLNQAEDDYQKGQIKKISSLNQYRLL